MIRCAPLAQAPQEPPRLGNSEGPCPAALHVERPFAPGHSGRIVGNPEVIRKQAPGGHSTDVPQIPRAENQSDTSKTNSSSTGVPSGRLATPYTRRLGFLSLPKTSCSNSEAPSATFGCSRTSPTVATDTPSRTIRVTLSSDPKCCRAHKD
jgi:hypothetical protein